MDFQQKEFPPLVERELESAPTRKVKTVIGPRRSGKTYLLFQQMKKLIEGGARKENMVFLNFEDARLLGLDFKEIRDVIKLHWQLYPASTKDELHVFADEPQNVTGWENAFRSLYDEGFDIHVTGSSSKLLSREIATAMRGRTLSHLLLPFSFREYLAAKRFPPSPNVGSREQAELLAYLDDYLDYGGFPEIAMEENEENRKKTLAEYFNAVIYRDVVERHDIRNTQAVKWLLKMLTESMAKEFSLHKTFQTLKSMGLKISKNTLYTYLSAVEDVFYVFLVRKSSTSKRKTELSMAKTYLCDNAYFKLVETAPAEGRKMENAVFLELKRRQDPLEEITYWKNALQEEVDFVVTQGNHTTQLIQVTKEATDPDVKKREVKALLKASRELACDSLTVITRDFEATEKHSGKKIEFTPLWKWLLQEGSRKK